MAGDKLIEVLRNVVRDMYSDYEQSKRSELVKLREELYHKYYHVEKLRIGRQNRPVVFVDAGFRVFDTDIATLIIMNIGAMIRDEEGNLLRVSEISDYPPINTYFMYGRIIDQEDSVELNLRIYPVDEESIPIGPRDADKLSNSLTELINRDVKDAMKTPMRREKITRSFKRLIRYIRDLLEIAYAIKVDNTLVRDSIMVVDGTLARWFKLRRFEREKTSAETAMGIFRFDGVDILSKTLNMEKDEVRKKLTNIYGLIKTTTFTSIARAKSIFEKHTSIHGLYTNITEDSVKKSVEFLNEEINRKKEIRPVVESAIHILNKISHPNTNIWVAKFPITGDNVHVMYLEVYTSKPIIKLEGSQVVYNEDSIIDVHNRIETAVDNIMAYRTSIEGHPPSGFMEVDADVRMERDIVRELEDEMVIAIRKYARREGHPLELVFSTPRRMRIGYRYRYW